MTLSTAGNAAFTATGGGTVNVTGTNTLATTTATALNVDNTNIGASGITFRSISSGTAASGPAKAIILNAVGSGNFTVTGDGSTANSAGRSNTLLAHPGPRTRAERVPSTLRVEAGLTASAS